MKKIILILFSLMLAISVSAISEPKPLVVIPLAMEEPISPGTGIQGECEPWAIKNEYCSNDIRHWSLCHKTVSGGVWQEMSENCRNYGSDVVCLDGKCRRYNDITESIFYIVLILALVIFVIYLKKRKKR